MADLLSLLTKKCSKGTAPKEVVAVSPAEVELISELLAIGRQAKELEARKAELQAVLYPILEDKRAEMCFRRQRYIGALSAGPATYSVANQWSGVDGGDPDAMSALRSTIAGIMGDEVDGWMASNLRTTVKASVSPEALARPEVLAALTALGDAVTITATVVPAPSLAESLPGTTNYDILASIEASRAVKRYSGTLR